MQNLTGACERKKKEREKEREREREREREKENNSGLSFLFNKEQDFLLEREKKRELCSLSFVPTIIKPLPGIEYSRFIQGI